MWDAIWNRVLTVLRDRFVHGTPPVIDAMRFAMVRNGYVEEEKYANAGFVWTPKSALHVWTTWTSINTNQHRYYLGSPAISLVQGQPIKAPLINVVVEVLREAIRGDQMETGTQVSIHSQRADSIERLTVVEEESDDDRAGPSSRERSAGKAKSKKTSTEAGK